MPDLSSGFFSMSMFMSMGCGNFGGEEFREFNTDAKGSMRGERARASAVWLGEGKLKMLQKH